jgi:hypothetical protein
LISLFIYYRITERDRSEAEALVRAMQARVACRSGVAARLLKKHDEPGLWMETYEPIIDVVGFRRLLGQLEDEYDLAMFIDGVRHYEVFDCEPTGHAQCRAVPQSGDA